MFLLFAFVHILFNWIAYREINEKQQIIQVNLKSFPTKMKKKKTEDRNKSMEHKPNRQHQHKQSYVKSFFFSRIMLYAMFHQIPIGKLQALDRIDSIKIVDDESEMIYLWNAGLYIYYCCLCFIKILKVIFFSR